MYSEKPFEGILTILIVILEYQGLSQDLETGWPKFMDVQI